MPQAVDNISLTLEQLSEQVRNLERRVAALESGTKEAPSSEPAPTNLPLERPRPPATWRGFPPVETPSGFVPIFGKAVLGIAGAYLLRALAESSSIPKLPVLFVAILYACVWMVWAVRVHAVSRLASNVYAVTSALILSPMLWESTVRFQALSPSLAAAVTVGFVILAIALAWQQNLQLIPWVATLTSVITALALIIETHELVPLTFALLAVALITEAVACLGHRLTLRAIPALASDFAVWLLIFILAADNIPEGYHSEPVSVIVLLCFLLLGTYGASIGVRSFSMREPLTPFEIAQGVLAFGLTAWGTLRVTQGAIAPVLGALFLAMSVICYWGTLSRFAGEEYTRNRRVCATWAAALTLSGSFLLFPVPIQNIFLCLTSVVATFLYTRTQKISLGLHASLYVAAAAAISPLPTYAGDCLAGSIPGGPDWRIWLLASAAAVSYAVGSRTAETQTRSRWLWLVPAALVALTVTALAVVAIAHLATGLAGLAASTISVVRTVVICAVALSLATLGTRFRRIELGWLAYAAVALGTLKLLLEDLRFGNPASLVVSLLFYGLILIFLPRVMRRSSVQP